MADEHQEGIEFSPDLYKKWFRSKTQAGFISLRPWEETLKVSIDIGEVSVPGNKAMGNTVVWTDMIPLLVFLRTGNPHGFSTFGGGRMDGKPVSRTFAIDGAFDMGRRWWKVAHLPATAAGSGAFIPNKGEPAISQNSIKMTKEEELEIAYRLDVLMHGYAARNAEWFHPKARDGS